MHHHRLLALAIGLLAMAILTPALAQSWHGSEAIAIQAASSKGKPIAGARVVLTHQGRGGEGNPPEVATDQKGRAVIAGLAPGSWQVEVQHPDFLSYVAVFDLERGKKPSISASFLEAGGGSLTPMKVKLTKGNPRDASPPLPAREARSRPPLPVESEPPAVAAEIPTTPRPEETTRQPEPALPADSIPAEEEKSSPAPEPLQEPSQQVAPPEQRSEPRPEPSVDSPPTGEAGAATTTSVTAESAMPAEAQPTMVPEPTAPEPIEAEPIEPEPIAPESPAPESPEPQPIAPESVEPEPVQPEPVEPEPVEPEATTPDSPVPQPVAPESVEPQSVEPDPVEPESTMPESPVPQPVEPEPVAPEPIVPEPIVPEPSEDPGLGDQPETVEVPAERSPMEEVPGPTAQPVVPAETAEEAAREQAPPEVTAEAKEQVEVAAPREPAIEQPVAEEVPTPVTPTVSTPIMIPDDTPAISSYRDGSCQECRTGEWALTALQPVAASSAPCPAGASEAALLGAEDLGNSMRLELTGFVGPAADGSDREALKVAEPEVSRGFRQRLAPYLGGASNCQMVSVVLPKSVRFAGFLYEAFDEGGGGACTPDRGCLLSRARWLGNPVVQRGFNATVVWGIFENTADDKARYVKFKVYFRPPNSRWQPSNR